jgi:hypothetical protein
MTRLARFIILLIVFTMSGATFLPAEDRKGGDDGVKKELAKQEAAWAVAVESNDPHKIGRFFTEDFLFVGAGGVLQDRAQHLEDFPAANVDWHN